MLYQQIRYSEESLFFSEFVVGFCFKCLFDFGIMILGMRGGIERLGTQLHI